MQYYRCKCGDTESYGSMPPSPCAKCKKCGSNLSISPKHHTKPKPHNWIKRKVETDDGEKGLTVCGWCGIKKIDFEKQEKAGK